MNKKFKTPTPRIYLEKFLEDFGNKSTVYTALVEAITNAVDAIRNSGNNANGHIDVRIERDATLIDGQNAPIRKITIEDNGIGFTEDNRNSFNTLYSQLKSSEGGKGLGRMFYIKYFRDVTINSIYLVEGSYYSRNFRFGRKYDIIEEEENGHIAGDDSYSTGTTLTLSGYIGKTTFNDGAGIFAHRILEKILNYYIDDALKMPKITIHDGSETICLDSLIGNNELCDICKKDCGNFTIKDQEFHYQMFELRRVYTQKSKILLTANSKVVTETKIENYIPEFATDFVSTDSDGQDSKYIVRFYVYGNYLDKNVNNERTEFNFADEADMVFSVGKKDIEKQTALEAKRLLGYEVKTRLEAKRQSIEEYAEQNVWYKPYVQYLDIEQLKMNLSNEDIENELHLAKFRQDKTRRENANKIFDFNLPNKDFSVKTQVEKIVDALTETDKSNLAEYIASRQTVLRLFEKALQWDSEEKYEKECVLHDIIFPKNRDSSNTDYSEHNLWIIDEKLNFTSYLCSDKQAFTESKDRPDIAAFHYPVSYRGANETQNPVSIFEFKRPGRFDFIRKPEDDPVEQIVRYVKQFRDGKIKTPEGREVFVSENTPFYGYVIADADKEVRDWLLDVKDMKALPDNQGWFDNRINMNLHIEFITWEKLLKDAEIRHRIFFEKLDIC